MKNLSIIIIISFFISATQGCLSKVSKKQAVISPADTQTVADTGFTGIRQYYSHSTLSYEVTLKNGTRQGLMRSFYPGGKLRQTFWYEKGMKEDTAIWFYEEGAIFRKTPFRRDSMNGTQIQYYKSGAVRAKMNFVNGLRTPYLEEFTSDGKKITDYPAVIIKTKDDYMTKGTYNIYMELDKKNVKVSFYYGEFSDGLFVPKTLKRVNTSDYAGYLQLRKSPSPGKGSAGIISEISTSLGNKIIVYKKVDLPYNDLK
jgi:antitoxin component YwqK of YwqJK toxin-antitoxin module